MIDQLRGKTFTKVVLTHNNTAMDSDTLDFIMSDGSGYRMYHSLSCCESVCIEDIAGELSDLEGTPILEAEEVSSDGTPPLDNIYGDDAYEWTFYKIGTIKGHVNIRWYGTSNGYYSTSVDWMKFGIEMCV